MKRRNFLKLLAASLAAAGVSAVTITNVFAEPKADKMAVGEAIRRLVKRYDAATTTEQREKIMLDALRVMSEAHRDHGLVWACGAVLYIVELTNCVNDLIHVTTRNKNEPRVKEFLAGLRTSLAPDADPSIRPLLMYKAEMARREMGGKGDPINHYTLKGLEEHHPKVYAQHLKEHGAPV
jgi:hypothetical protein